MCIPAAPTPHHHSNLHPTQHNSPQLALALAHVMLLAALRALEVRVDELREQCGDDADLPAQLLHSLAGGQQ